MKYRQKTPKPQKKHILTLTDVELSDIQFALYVLDTEIGELTSTGHVLADEGDRKRYRKMYDSLREQQRKANQQ